MKTAKTVVTVAPAAPKISARRAAFVRLAEGRTKRAVDDVRLIGNLSNLANYEFNEGDIDVIFDAIETEIGAAKARFKASFQQRDRRPVRLGFVEEAEAAAAGPTPAPERNAKASPKAPAAAPGARRAGAGRNLRAA